MTHDLIYTFKNFFNDNKVVLDTYKMNNGYYYLIKKNGSIQRLIIKDNMPSDYELYKYIKLRDFYSKYLASNKAIDTTYTEIINNKKYTMLKKICSNNIYTVFFKNKYVIGLCSEEADKDAVPVEVFEKGIDKYYESLQKLGSKKEEDGLLKETYTKEEIEINREKMKEAFTKVFKDFSKQDKPRETWIKIFLDEEEDEYERVGNIYLKLKLFNSNTNNVSFNNEIYGTNNYNYGLNGKKPFLELKTTPYKVGARVSTKEIDILNKMYIWLYNNGIQQNVLKIPLDWKFNGVPRQDDNNENINVNDEYILKIVGNNGVARIDDYQYVTKFSKKIRMFTCKDYIRKNTGEFKTENIYGLEWYVNNIWIANNKKCERNYLREAYYDYDAKISKSMLNNWKKEVLKNYKDIFFEVFQKENEKIFTTKLDEVASEIVSNTIIDGMERGKGFLLNAVDSLNLWIALKTYFNKEGEEEMKINNIQKKCEEIVIGKGKITTDEEYYYLIGQAAFYLLSKSKASKLTQDVTSPFVKSNNLKRLKEELKFLYEKYNYDIYLNDTKFNNILSQLLIQEPDTSIKQNKDIILAGMLSNNVFYNKKEIENGGNENGKNE